MTLEELERLLRAERKRGLRHAWTYDLARHRGLYKEYLDRLRVRDQMADSWRADEVRQACP